MMRNQIGHGYYNRTSLRGALTLLTVGGAVGMIWSSATGGIALTQLAKAVGMPALGFGILASVPYYGHFFQFLGSYLTERFGHRKTIYVLCGIIHRGLWLPIALLPVILPLSWGGVALVVLIGMSWIFSYFSQPAFSSWVADLIPASIQGRFFSKRTAIAMATSLVASYFISVLLDRGQSAGSLGMRWLMVTLVAAGALLGIVEFVLYIFVPNPATHNARPSISFWQNVRKPLRDREFVCIVAFYAGTYFAGIFTSQFMLLFLLDVVKMSNTRVNMITGIVPSLLFIFAFPFWGKVVDRVGYKPVFKICNSVLIFQSTWLIFLDQTHFWIPYLFGLFTYFFYPGFEMAQNIVTLTKSRSSETGEGNTAYPAFLGFGVAMAGMLSGLAAGAVAETLGKDWHATVGTIHLTYHGCLFLIATGIRLLTLPCLLGLENTKGYTTWSTLQEILAQFRTDVREWIVRPWRWLAKRQSCEPDVLEK